MSSWVSRGKISIPMRRGMVVSWPVALGARHRRRGRRVGNSNLLIGGARDVHDGGSAAGRQPFSRISRPFSRSQDRFFSVSRLSCSFLPRATAISTFARPLSLK